jgi:flagellar assembly protein FliH
LAETFEFGALEPALDAEHATARARLEALAEDARRRGHEQGHADGIAEARALVEPALAALAEAERQVRALQEEFATHAEAAAVELAIAIAEKVIGGAVEARPEVVLDVVAGALLRTTARAHLVIEVNPEEFELVRDAADQLADRLGGVRRLDVVSERRVARGGCLVRTEEGEIDARVDSQLERVRELMTEARRRTHVEPLRDRRAA